MKTVERIDPKYPHQTDTQTDALCEVMDVLIRIDCGNNEIIMLYTLNILNFCQLVLHKTRMKKKEIAV